MLRILALLLALIAVGCMSLSIVGIVTGSPNDNAGWALRVIAVVCFAGAVALNAVAH
jgi:hypothetical protein